MKVAIITDAINEVFGIYLILDGHFVPVVTFTANEYEEFMEVVARSWEHFQDMKLLDQTVEFINSLEAIDGLS